MKTFPHICMTAALGLALVAFAAVAQAPLPPRDVPAKSIPVPDTVSPEMQAIIAQPLRKDWDKPPNTPEGWRQLADNLATGLAPQVGPMAERLHVKIEPATIGGVKVYRLTPDQVPARNANRLLVHVHGGCYVLNPGEAALPEAVLMAGFGRMKVIAVDYRMPPDAYFPAALD
ncbi:MAG: alpha/beta hydrolase fold domain-containing protein, partial [Acetobacteraceae bacterium]|nr:alpha/beta hydrolase fold domain-containing protein [Acetobacteraceae bacterium]